MDLSVSLTEGMVGCEPNELTGDTFDGNKEEEEAGETCFFVPIETREFLRFKETCMISNDQLLYSEH